MNNQLPSEFDLIIVGTGIIESIVSAAASRIGKRVLHIDTYDYYGGQWASFNLESIQKLDCKNLVENTESNVRDKGDGTIVNLGNDLFQIKDFKCKWHIPLKCEEKETSQNEGTENAEDSIKESCKTMDNPIVFTQESMLKESRKFNIDLTPKLHFARGDFVELLISSNIARYSEYRSVSRVLTWLNNQLEVVPCSRSDVFANSKVSVIEKRMLMKLLTSLDESTEELQNYENKTFRAFLKDRKLTPSLISYVLYAISMSTDETPCLEGIANTKRFLNSLGRFGKTPFLFCMYGSGETPQAFCRLSAVFGGVYALNQTLNSFICKENKFQTLICGEQHINADHFVMSIEKAPKEFVQKVPKDFISRGIFVTDRSVMDSEKEHLTLLLYPPENDQNLVTVIELGTLTGTCPKNLYIVHLISKQKTSPEEDLKHVANNLFADDFKQENVNEDCKPQILWHCYFSIPDTSNSDLKKNVPENLFLCSGPDLDLDYDQSIKKAKDIFNKIYPELEFLPRAPDPEEIVIEGEDDDNDENTNENEQVKSENKNDANDNKGESENNVDELVKTINDNMGVEDI